MDQIFRIIFGAGNDHLYFLHFAMGASHSATNLSETLAECDHDILKYVLGQPGSHVKEIFLRFVETQKVVEANNEKETAPGPVMENAAQFSKIFTATNNDHHHWMKLFEVLDTKNDSYVDFYEAISTTAICCSSSAMTKIHLLLQIFDYDNDEHLTRPELLLLLRSTVTGVRKLCGFPPLSINIFEQLVSHAFATSSSSSSIHKKAGLSYIDFSSWVRMNEDVKCFIAAVSPAAIHSAQKKQQEGHHRRASRKPSVHNAMYHNINYSLQNQKGDNAAEMTPKKQHRLHIAAMLHKKHCLEHLKACQELREMYNAMDTQQINRVTLGDFTGSLPNTLKPMAGDMFRSMCSGKYLHFEQLLHEIYPHMTHNEIGMLCSASKKKKNRGTRRPPPVKLSAEQTEEMYAMFDMYNSDHSGNMSVAELTAAMTATGVFTKEECKNYFDLADHHNHHVLNKNDFVHFFQSSFIAEEMAPIFVAHPDDFTPLNSIPHEHNHILL